jgi:hypothetical protein
MIMLMNILRKLGVGLSATLLTLALFGVAWSHVSLATIGNRETVKGWLARSDFYNKAVDIALDKIKESANTEGDSLPVNDPQIQAVAKQALSADFLKTNIETALDSTYDWLGSNDKDMSLTVDLSGVKQQLATGLGTYATTKVTSLPVCASGMKTNEDFDPFNAACRPANLSAEAAGQKVADQILQGDFLKDPVINASDIKVKDNNGKEIPLTEAAQGQAVRKTYKFSGYVPYILGVLALLSILGLIFLSQDRLLGLRRTGSILLTTGTILLITFVGIGVGRSMVGKQLGTTGSLTASQKELGTNLLTLITDDVRRVLLIYSIGFIVFGLVGIIVASIMKKRRKSTEAPTAKLEEKEPIKEEPAREKPEPPKIQL